MFTVTFLAFDTERYVLSSTVPTLIAKGLPVSPHWKQLSVFHYFLLFRIIKAISFFFSAMLLQFKPHYIRLCFTNMYTEFVKIELYFN